MKQETVTLRCEDGAESVVFAKYIFKTLVSNPYEGCEDIIKKDISYEINVEDSYIGGDYKGFFGRIKRAWRAFWDKPVIYTGIYCEDTRKMRQFLYDCLDLVNDNPDTSNNEEQVFLKGLYDEDSSATSNEGLIKKGE